MRSADQKDIEQIPRDHWGFMQRMHGRRQTLVVPRQYTLRQLLLAFVVFALFMGTYRWAQLHNFFIPEAYFIEKSDAPKCQWRDKDGKVHLPSDAELMQVPPGTWTFPGNQHSTPKTRIP